VALGFLITEASFVPAEEKGLTSWG